MFELFVIVGCLIALAYWLFNDDDVIKDKQTARAMYTLGREGHIKRVEVPYPIGKE